MAGLPIRFIGALLGIVICAAAWQGNVNTSSWSGVIINFGCTADEAFAESDKCFERSGSDARVALYDDTVRHVYDLDAQQEAAPYFGESVTVEGTLQDKTIRVSTIRKLTSIGLATGHRAPAFSLRDQFGRSQDLETLKASQGTVLLFFRSADW
jgi:hypothetical protein